MNKNIFSIVTFVFILFFVGLVSADMIERNNFVYASQPINSTSVMGFTCSSLDCSTTTQQIFNNQILNSGSNSYLSITYPNSGSNVNYGLFVFKEGYIPFEVSFTGNLSGNSPVPDATDLLTRKDVCNSTLTDLEVTNNSNVVTIKTNIRAPINHSGPLNFVPTQIVNQYTVNVTLLLKVNGSVNQTKVVKLNFSEVAEQNFTVPLSSGTHLLEIISVSNDLKCLSSDNQSKTSSITLVNNNSSSPTCTSWDYSEWSVCSNGQQTRTNTSSSPSGCIGGSPILSQTCSVPPTNSNLSGVKITSPINTTIYNSTILPLNYSINGTATLCNYSLNGQNFNLTNCSSGWINASNGINHLIVFVSNGTVHFSDAVNFTVNVSSSNDNTDPNITIHSPKPVNNQTNNITINFSSDEIVTCSYLLSGGVNKTFSSPNTFFVSYENLSNGNYTLNIFCVDGSTNNATKNVSFIVNVTSGGNDNDDDKDNTDNKKISGGDYVLLRGANETVDYLVLNKEEKEVSPWALFLVFLLLCVLVLFFIVLVLLMRDRK